MRPDTPIPRPTDLTRRHFIRSGVLSLGAGGLGIPFVGTRAAAPEHGSNRLRVSADRRRLERTDGKPFFWLADTAWELVHRLTREETEHYLTTRRDQGFTVLQVIALPEYGHHIANRYGHTPFTSVSPQELVPNEDYFRHMDWLLRRAEDMGLYVLLFPSWRYYWREMPKQTSYKPILTPENCRKYGQYLGQRYKDRSNLLWSLGGDMLPANDTERAITEETVAGLRAGGSDHLKTYHPGGEKSSSKSFADTAWLDFHMCQSGHRPDYPVWDLIGADWNHTPAKPIIDGESLYEGIPRPLWLHMNGKPQPYSTDYEVRRAAYAGVFAGGFGYTYGANGIFQFHDKGGPTKYDPKAYWREAIQFPGANQMRYLRRLMESRPQSGRIPDQGLLTTAEAGSGNRVSATRAADGSYAMVYTAGGKPFSLDLTKLAGSRLAAHWYSPRDGAVTSSEQFDRRGTKPFTPPSNGVIEDWVLVVDNVERSYPRPGE